MKKSAVFTFIDVFKLLHQGNLLLSAGNSKIVLLMLFIIRKTS